MHFNTTSIQLKQKKNSKNNKLNFLTILVAINAYLNSPLNFRGPCLELIVNMFKFFP